MNTRRLKRAQNSASDRLLHAGANAVLAQFPKGTRFVATMYVVGGPRPLHRPSVKPNKALELLDAVLAHPTTRNAASLRDKKIARANFEIEVQVPHKTARDLTEREIALLAAARRAKWR